MDSRFAVESGQENGPLVLKCLVDAVRGRLHGLRQIGNRRRMIGRSRKTRTDLSSNAARSNSRPLDVVDENAVCAIQVLI